MALGRLLNLRDPYFLAGLILRLGAILFVVPAIHANWFVPFLQHGLAGNPLDPWATHLAAGADPLAFPYGLVMLVLLLPAAAMAGLASGTTHALFIGQLGLGLNILLLDVALLAVLSALRPGHERRLLIFYWLSPLVLYICYWHGQLDVAPVLLVMVAVLLVARHRPGLSGAAMGLAAASKMSMVLPAPFLLVYFFNSKRHRSMLAPFIAGGAIAFLIAQLPTVASEAARQMVLGTPEIQKIYDLSIGMRNGLEIYLLPIVYLMLLYFAWRIRRMSFDLLLSLMGVAFLMVVLLTPASPGWYLWVAPLLVLQMVVAGPRVALIAVAFSVIVVGFHLLQSTGAAIPGAAVDLTQPLAYLFQVDGGQFRSLWLSGLIAVGLMLATNLLIGGVLRNDYFQLSRRPLVIGIAGDSGAGKDTLSDAIAGLFDPRGVAQISGDDYHLWDRHKPMWQVMTHLNPQANDLQKFTEDVVSLSAGRSIHSRHYDHRVGRMTKPRLIESNDVVIASGLHALYRRTLLDCYDLSIFLDMDNGLRRHFKLQRDIDARGHTGDAVLQALQRREPDRDQFIQPQARNADVVFALLPLQPVEATTDSRAHGPVRMKLHVTLRHGAYYEALVRRLVGICGMHVDVVIDEVGTSVDIRLEGDVTADDIALAAQDLIPHRDELVAREPQWQDGLLGVMQLFVVAQAIQALRKRVT